MSGVDPYKGGSSELPHLGLRSTKKAASGKVSRQTWSDDREKAQSDPSPNGPVLHHGRIIVTGADPVTASEEVSALSLRPEATANGQVALPSKAQFELILAQATTPEDLAAVEKMMAACVDLAKHCDQIQGQLAEFTIMRLRARRKLGLVLLQTDRRGGDRAKNHDDSLLNGKSPRVVDPNTAERCRKLAKAAEHAIEEYFATTVAAGKVPTEAGALRHAAKIARVGKRPKARAARKPKAAGAEATGTAIGLPPAVLDAVSRIMTPDVCVGNAKIQAGCFVSPSAKTVFDQIKGDVFVTECPDPAVWLRRLRKLRNSAQVTQAVVVLPAEVWADWFADLEREEWCVCFLRAARDYRGHGVALVHQGARSSAFRVALAELATFL